MTTNRIDKHFVSLTAPETFAAERYQGLRLRLEGLKGQNRRVIAITSPGAGDGKTLTSVNLAGVLAREPNARVLLIDADLRRSSVGVKFGIPEGTSGLADLISGSSKRPVASLIQRPEPCRFDVLPAGSSSMSIQELFRSPKLKEILDEARQRYDYVLLDTPPLVPVFDAAVLARAVDGVIMVVAADRTPRKMLAAALDLLEPSSVIGLVFNADNSPLFGYNSSAYRPYYATRSVHA